MIVWTDHLQLAEKAARRLHRRLPRHQVAVEELEQDAMIGLHRAAQAFDPSKGATFPTFAAKRITGAMLDGLRERDVLSRGSRARGDRAAVSLQHTLFDGQSSIERILADNRAPTPDRELLNESVLDLVEQVITDTRTAQMVRLYFERDLNLRQVAYVFDVSESRASQLLGNAFRILRSAVTVTAEGDLTLTPERRSLMPTKTNGTHLAVNARPEDTVAAVERLQELPPWMTALRDAMKDSISADDIKQVMKAQVEKARSGDRNAANFVMNQAHKMMQTQASLQRPVQITQNNYYDQPAGVRPDTPIEPGDGTDRQLDKLRARARAGQPVTGHNGDSRFRTYSDEEEKELRNRMDAENEE